MFIAGLTLTIGLVCVALNDNVDATRSVPSAHRAVPAPAAVPVPKPDVRSVPEAPVAVAAPDDIAALAALAQASHSCPRRSATVVCVDQGHQLLWVQQGRQIIFPAVRARTGRSGWTTPDGIFRIFKRNETQWSHLFNEPMPYSAFFKGDYALHGASGDMREGPGSHGCVNLTVGDAQRLWSVLGVGDFVYIWGQRPGT